MDVFEGIEVSEEIKTAVQSKVEGLIESLKSEFKTANDAEVSKKLEAIQTRDQAKAKLREIEAKFKDVNLEELNSFKTKYAEIEPVVTQLNEKLQSYEAKFRDGLKEKFSAEKWEVVKDFDLLKIEELAKLESKAKGTEPNRTAPNSNLATLTKAEYTALTTEQRAALPKEVVMRSLSSW